MNSDISEKLTTLERETARLALLQVRIKLLGALPADATNSMEKWNTLQLAIRVIDEELKNWL